MDERSVSILMFLARQIVEGADINEDIEDMKLTLYSQGYFDKEVDEALDWIEATGARIDIAGLYDDTVYTNRIMSPEESMNIVPNAFGFLIRLKNMGVLDGGLLEEIMQKAQAADFEEIGFDEIKLIIVFSLYKRDDYPDWRRIIKHVMEGGWNKLKH